MEYTDYVRARVTPEVKLQAESIFSKLGFGHTEAIRMFYQQVILNGGIPFELKLPNKVTIEAMAEVKARKNLVKSDLAELRKKFK